MVVAILALTFSSCDFFSKTRREERIKQKIDQEVDNASQLIAQDHVNQALELLEELSLEYPNRPEILIALAFAYSTHKDFSLAASTFERISKLDGSYQENALYAARAYQEDNNLMAAVENYCYYLKFFPDDFDTWRSVAESEALLKHHQKALEAYFFILPKGKLSGLDYAKMGNLFFEVNNVAQAEFWYAKAAELSDGKEQGKLGLVQIACQRKEWPVVEKLLAELDSVEGDRIDKIALVGVRRELNQWKAQKAEEVRLEKERKELEEKDLQLQAQLKKEGEEKALLQKKLEEERVAKQKLEQELIAKKQAEDERIAREKEEAEKLKEKAEQAVLLAKQSEEKLKTVKLRQLFDQQLYADAEKLANELASSSSTLPADLWFLLAQIHFNTNAFDKAHFDIQQAMHADDQNVQYAFFCLKLLQKTEKPEQLTQKLKETKEKFPQNPEITLATARAYEKIKQDKEQAVALYKEFLKLAPLDHKKRPEVEQKVQLLSK
ncbi:MAG: hypothetical protein A2007_03925 [Verrucomicrobia bacterium GWC2_42_7]|nr:MAG: hypothetical protein A2007_03925 [Verrucomicrobia bacterium GWC2_42_7]